MKKDTPVRLKSLVICTGLAGLMVTGIAPAQAAAPAATKMPEVVIEVTDAGFKLPATVPGGIVGLTIRNTGKQPHTGNVLRVRPGKTTTETLKFLSEPSDDVVGAFNLISAVYLGDPLPPGQSSERVIVDLKKGDYVLEDAADPKKRQHATFKVTTVGNTVAPKTDVLVNMQDFAFGLPGQIKAGKLTWQVKNVGKQWHVLVIVKTKPGATTDDILKLFAENGPVAPDPNAKAQIVGGIAPISEGERQWVEVDLQPGTYTLICPLPDLTTMTGQGEPMNRVQHGMMKTLTVK